MGIKFLCPNGHKLNVKTFLAGKRGICPHCGASFDIPLASTRGSGAASEPVEAEQGEGIIEQGASSPQSEIPVAVRAAGGSAVANFPSVESEAAYHPTVAEQAPVHPSPAYQAPVHQTPTAVPPTPVSSADPIAEAPQANWYVRPPTGGQYGPAPGDIMRRWVSEGRVSVDSLIWREGWAEWQTAGAVFSSTFAASQVAAPTAEETTSTRTSLPIVRRRKKAKSLPWFMIVLLAIAFIASIIIIVKMSG